MKSPNKPAAVNNLNLKENKGEVTQDQKDKALHILAKLMATKKELDREVHRLSRKRLSAIVSGDELVALKMRKLMVKDRIAVIENQLPL